MTSIDSSEIWKLGKSKERTTYLHAWTLKNLDIEPGNMISLETQRRSINIIGRAE